MDGRQTAWRPLLARLQLLAALLPIWGVAGSSGEGLPLEGLMKLAGAAFGHANADVRAAAIHLTVLVRQPYYLLCRDERSCRTSSALLELQSIRKHSQEDRT